jgi:hypothetical protein
MPRDTVSEEQINSSGAVAPPVDPVLATLIAARKLIEKPENWCQNNFGWKEHPFEKRYGPRCAWGAIVTAAGPGGTARSAAYKFISIIADRPLPCFNDAPQRTHAEVLELFDRAIAARRSA